MNGRPRWRFWVETALALLNAVLLLRTLIWHDWVEIVFNIDPDHYNGSFEWLIVAVALAATIATAALARHEWRRAAANV